MFFSNSGGMGEEQDLVEQLLPLLSKVLITPDDLVLLRLYASQSGFGSAEQLLLLRSYVSNGGGLGEEHVLTEQLV